MYLNLEALKIHAKVIPHIYLTQGPNRARSTCQSGAIFLPLKKLLSNYISRISPLTLIQEFLIALFLEYELLCPDSQSQIIIQQSLLPRVHGNMYIIFLFCSFLGLIARAQSLSLTTYVYCVYMIQVNKITILYTEMMKKDDLRLFFSLKV